VEIRRRKGGGRRKKRKEVHPSFDDRVSGRDPVQKKGFLTPTKGREKKREGGKNRPTHNMAGQAPGARQRNKMTLAKEKKKEGGERKKKRGGRVFLAHFRPLHQTRRRKERKKKEEKKKEKKRPRRGMSVRHDS